MKNLNVMRIAITSDIHGNSWALKEVLKDIRSKNISTIIDLGDSLYGPLDPIGTYHLIKENNILSICGNQDEVIFNPENEANTTLTFVQNNLTNEAINWLISLPETRSLYSRIIAFHASPNNISQYLVEELNEEGVCAKPIAELDKVLSGFNEDIVVCGHSHKPGIIKTQNKTIINPGSVGLQAYSDNSPIFHKMETLNPFAKYGIVNLSDELIIEQVSVQYDYKSAYNCAIKNNRNDWANWILTGRA